MTTTLGNTTQKLVTTITTILQEECSRPSNLTYALQNEGMFPSYIADDLISPMVSCCWEVVVFNNNENNFIVTVMHDDEAYGDSLDHITLTK